MKPFKWALGALGLATVLGAAAGMALAATYGGSGETDDAASQSGSVSLPDPAALWDHLWREIVIDLLVIGVIFALAAIYMLIRYRARSPDHVGTAKELSKSKALAWALIPAAIFMADDLFLSAKGWTLWNVYRRVPDNAMEVKVTGYQWYWEFEYENGVTTEVLNIPVGQPVVLRMTAEDVIHSFFVPEYRVKEDVMPGRVTYVWFNPVRPVNTVVTCTEYCGTAHANMYTEVNAMPRADFEAWMAKEKAEARAPEENPTPTASVLPPKSAVNG